ncbi:MAG: hypothetical protein Q9160_006732 [Pyrenula sp. 1 TL-2023]
MPPKAAKENDRNPAKLGYALPKFFQTAWELFQEDDANVSQEIVKLLASDGGLVRIKEATEITTNSSKGQDSFDSIDESFVPLLNTITHEAAVKSPLLESPVGRIHNCLFGPNGDRACQLYPYLTAYAKSLERTTSEGSKKAITVLKFFHKAADINSNAKVTEPLVPIIESLADLISDDMSDAAEEGYLIDRIRSRMGLGRLIPSKQDKNIDRNKQTQKANVHFEIFRDLPGNLGANGSRHDNDHEDIENIEILPTSQEIESTRSEYLPVFDRSRLHKAGLEGLIDRQFRLLREDTVGQLRDAVREERYRLMNPQNQHHISGYQERARKNVYRNVHLEDIIFS